MRESPAAYIFESDGTVHRQRQLEGDELSEVAPMDEEGLEVASEAKG